MKQENGGTNLHVIWSRLFAVLYSSHRMNIIRTWRIAVRKYHYLIHTVNGSRDLQYGENAGVMTYVSLVTRHHSRVDFLINFSQRQINLRNWKIVLSKIWCSPLYKLIWRTINTKSMRLADEWTSLVEVRIFFQVGASFFFSLWTRTSWKTSMKLDWSEDVESYFRQYPIHVSHLGDSITGTRDSRAVEIVVYWVPRDDRPLD